MSGKKGEIKSVDLSISAGLDKPLEITPGKFNLEGKVDYTIEEVEKGKQYKINFRNHPDLKGKLTGVLRLGTNYKEKPEIKIIVNSRFY